MNSDFDIKISQSELDLETEAKKVNWFGITKMEIDSFNLTFAQLQESKSDLEKITIQSKTINRLGLTISVICLCCIIFDSSSDIALGAILCLLFLLSLMNMITKLTLISLVRANIEATINEIKEINKRHDKIKALGNDDGDDNDVAMKLEDITSGD